ncbi:MAG: hypothetical protein U0768_14395 [Anaerolineae bacterium]
MFRTLSYLVLVLALVPVLSACRSASPGGATPPLTATTAPVAEQAQPSATPAAAPSETPVPPRTELPTAVPSATKQPAATNTPVSPPPTAVPKSPPPTPTLPTIWNPSTIDGNHIDRFANIGLRDPHPPGAVTALTLQMLARIKGQNHDGGGIDNVRFVIRDSQDNDVYQHEENSAPFCAFQEASGTMCRTLQMTPGLKWRKSDDGSPPMDIRSGAYMLEVTVNGHQGESWIGKYNFRIK